MFDSTIIEIIRRRRQAQQERRRTAGQERRHRPTWVEISDPTTQTDRSAVDLELGRRSISPAPSWDYFPDLH